MLRDEVTAREWDIIELAALGWRRKWIGWRLGIACGTVGQTLSRIYEKTDTADHLELAMRFWHERLGEHPRPAQGNSKLDSLRDGRSDLQHIPGRSGGRMHGKSDPIRYGDNNHTVR